MNTRDEFFAARQLLFDDRDAYRARALREPAFLELRSGLGETLLHWLAIEDFFDEVRFLSNLRIPVDALNMFGASALMECASIGRTEMVELLLELGANPNLKSEREGETALHVAARSGHLSVAVRLLAAGAAVNALNADRETPLHLAASRGERQACECLVAAGADWSAQNSWGETPFDLLRD